MSISAKRRTAEISHRLHFKFIIYIISSSRLANMPKCDTDVDDATSQANPQLQMTSIHFSRRISD